MAGPMPYAEVWVCSAAMPVQRIMSGSKGELAKHITLHLTDNAT